MEVYHKAFSTSLSSSDFPWWWARSTVPLCSSAVSMVAQPEDEEVVVYNEVSHWGRRYLVSAGTHLAGEYWRKYSQ